MNKQYGFTVVELIAVITIIGILAAVAGPKMIGNDTFAARGSYSTILSAMRLAQKTAVAQRKAVYINLDASARVLKLCYADTNHTVANVTSCTTPLLDPATGAAYSKTFPSSVTLTYSIAATDPFGFAAGGQTIKTSNRWDCGCDATITVQNNAVTEAARTIKVWRKTGYAQ